MPSSTASAFHSYSQQSHVDHSAKDFPAVTMAPFTARRSPNGTSGGLLGHNSWVSPHIGGSWWGSLEVAGEVRGAAHQAYAEPATAGRATDVGATPSLPSIMSSVLGQQGACGLPGGQPRASAPARDMQTQLAPAGARVDSPLLASSYSVPWGNIIPAPAAWQQQGPPSCKGQATTAMPSVFHQQQQLDTNLDSFNFKKAICAESAVPSMLPPDPHWHPPRHTGCHTTAEGSILGVGRPRPASISVFANPSAFEIGGGLLCSGADSGLSTRRSKSTMPGSSCSPVLQHTSQQGSQSQPRYQQLQVAQATGSAAAPPLGRRRSVSPGPGGYGGTAVPAERSATSATAAGVKQGMTAELKARLNSLIFYK